ncbi:MAG: LysM domain-containing protein [Anaerolineae bacterium]
MRTNPPSRLRGILLTAAVLLLLALTLLLVTAQGGAQPAQIHVVQQGETAVGIAARYAVPLAQLMAANGLHELVLTPGVTLGHPRPAWPNSPGAPWGDAAPDRRALRRLRA